MKKIVFGITNLCVGGAERVVVDLANKLSEDNNLEITIFTLYGKGEFEKQLSKKVIVKSLYNEPYMQISKFKKKLITLKLLFLKKHIYNKNIKHKYNTEIAFLEGPITRLFSVKNKQAKKITWVHTDITKIFGNNLKSKLKRIYDKKVYDKYEKIIFVSKENLNKFRTTYPSINSSKLQVIHNYVNKEEVIKKSKETIDIEFTKDILNIVTVARLVKVKAIDRLIKVHKRLIQDNLQHNIYVIGDGPEKEQLQQIIKQENITQTFKLLGEKQNPYPYIKNADVFCLCSHYEGYPMTIVEAKLLNKYIITTDTAAKEAVEGYSQSLVLENSEDGIYVGLKRFLENIDEYINTVNEITEYNNEDVFEEARTAIS